MSSDQIDDYFGIEEAKVLLRRCHVYLITWFKESRSGSGLGARDLASEIRKYLNEELSQK